MQSASAITVIGTALFLTQEATALLKEYRDYDESIGRLHRKAKGAAQKFRLIQSALKDREVQLEGDMSTQSNWRLAAMEEDIWQGIKEATKDYQDAVKSFIQEGEEERPRPGLPSWLITKMMRRLIHRRESNIEKYGHDLDDFFQLVIFHLAHLLPLVHEENKDLRKSISSQTERQHSWGGETINGSEVQSNIIGNHRSRSSSFASSSTNRHRGSSASSDLSPVPSIPSRFLPERLTSYVGCQSLREAVNRNDINGVEEVICQNAHTYSVSDMKATAFLLAARWKSYAVLDRYAESANLRLKDPDGRTALLSALQGQDDIKLEYLRMLTRKGSDLTDVDKTGYGPIHYCVLFNRANSITQLLLQAGAEIDLVDQSKKTPLWHAVHRGKKDALVRYLLQNDAWFGPMRPPNSQGLWKKDLEELLEDKQRERLESIKESICRN